MRNESTFIEATRLFKAAAEERLGIDFLNELISNLSVYPMLLDSHNVYLALCIRGIVPGDRASLERAVENYAILAGLLSTKEKIAEFHAMSIADAKGYLDEVGGDQEEALRRNREELEKIMDKIPGFSGRDVDAIDIMVKEQVKDRLVEFDWAKPKPNERIH